MAGRRLADVAWIWRSGGVFGVYPDRLENVQEKEVVGMVMLLFVYVALRAMEREGAASFVAMYLGLSYWLGWTMDERAK